MWDIHANPFRLSLKHYTRAQCAQWDLHPSCPWEEGLPRVVHWELQQAKGTQATNMAWYLSLSPAYTIHMINCLHCFLHAHKAAVTCWVVSVCTVTSLGQGGYLCFVLEGAQLALKHLTGSQEMIQMEKQKHDLPGLDSISLSVLCSNQIRLARIERSDCLETVW